MFSVRAVYVTVYLLRGLKDQNRAIEFGLVLVFFLGKKDFDLIMSSNQMQEINEKVNEHLYISEPRNDGMPVYNDGDGDDIDGNDVNANATPAFN